MSDRERGDLTWEAAVGAGSAALGALGAVTTAVAPEARLMGLAAVITAVCGGLAVLITSVSKAIRRLKHPFLPEERD